jgi:hypothetical protein
MDYLLLTCCFDYKFNLYTFVATDLCGCLMAGGEECGFKCFEKCFKL